MRFGTFAGTCAGCSRNLELRQRVSYPLILNNDTQCGLRMLTVVHLLEKAGLQQRGCAPVG